MKSPWITGLLLLTFLAPLEAFQMTPPEREQPPGDKSDGEEKEILQREQWFSERRKLDELYRPGALRSEAVEDLKLRLANQTERVVAGSWQAVGPSPMNMLTWSMGRVAGRVSALAVSPVNEQILYLGAASGGLWKTVNGGSSWSSIFDSIGTQTIGSVALDPNDSNVVWVGTGEQGQSCSGYFGMGLFRSGDGGSTFAARNGSPGSTLDLSWVTAVAVRPGNSNAVLAGGSGFCSGGFQFGGGLFRSTDGGLSWSNRLSGQVNDIVFDPFVPDTVYAAVGVNGSASDGVYKSTDGGANWSLLSNGLPSGSSVRRMRLAMSPSNRLVLYALINLSSNTTGLYRSLDGGASWALRNSNACDGQCWYNLALDVSPNSTDTVLVGAIRVWRSTNGGTTLNVLTNVWGSTQRVHQDTHVVRYSRTNGNRFWVGSDGGLWRTDDGSNYTNLNANLNITQFYDIAVHPTNSSIVYGGAQDNSSARRVSSSIWDVVGVNPGQITGDGFNNAIDAGNNNYVFVQSYSSGSLPRIFRSTSGGGSGSFSALATGGITTESFPWKTEYTLLPAGSTSYMVTGGRSLYRANARAGTTSWTRIFNNLAGSPLSALGPAAGATLYAGFENGRIFRTDNAIIAAAAFIEVTGNFPTGNVVTDIAVDQTDRMRVFATRSAFTGSKLYRSTTGGTTWVAAGNGLPDVPANTVAIDPINRQRIFVGTDVGVFVSEDNGDNFVPQMAGLPLGTVVTDLEIDNAPHVLTAGTYGRGAWQLALPAEFSPCVVDGGVDDVQGNTSCCSGLSVSGSTFCVNPADFGGTWASCVQICGTAPVNNCIPSGGVDDILSNTSCCSGASVPNSAWCLDPTDWADGWASCVQTCQ